jgi:hypothetical protein
LTSLVKQIDSAKGVNSFVIFMSDDEKLKDAAVALAKKEGIKNTIFAIDNVAGPEGYKIHKDAEVTVLLYQGGKVEANHAYRKSEFNAKAVAAIVKDIPKIQK